MSSEFSREHYAVLAGKQAYSNNLRNLGNTSALLRRNIHRLEKGLIMKQRKNIFAEDYIQDTVSIYQKALETKNFDQEEIKWASDVLEEYFSVVAQTDIILSAMRSFKIFRDTGSTDKKYIPYLHSSLKEHEITFEQLQKLFQKRRAVRWYLQKPVPDELIIKAVNLASLAPSACNRQPFRFFISSNQEKAVEIAKCAGGTSGWVENIPCTIAVIGDLSNYPRERDRHLIYIDSSLAIMQLILAFETLGLSTCTINWPDVKEAEEKLQKIINLKSFERPIMLVSVGYPDKEGGIAYSQKKSNKLLIKRI